MKIEKKVSLHNKFEVRVLDPQGNVKSEQTAFNVVLDTIYPRLLAWMPFFQGIAFGTGEGTPDKTDTALFEYLGWKQMGMTDCGTIATGRSFPVFSRKRRITIHAHEYVGKTITEVGVAYSTSTSSSGDGGTAYSKIVTHAMLPIPVTKTELDVIQIDATVYLDFGEYLMDDYDEQVWWIGDNPIVDYFTGSTFPTCYWYLYSGRQKGGMKQGGQVGVSEAYVGRTEWIQNLAEKKVTTPSVRFDVSFGNGHVRRIGFGSSDTKGVFCSLLPIDGLFVNHQIVGDILPSGDGRNTKFDTKWNGFIKGTEEVFVDDEKVTTEAIIVGDRGRRVYEQGPLLVSTAYPYGVAFSHDSTYMAVVHGQSSYPYGYIYKKEGGANTRRSSLSPHPDRGQKVSFSPDSQYLAVAQTVAPYVSVYKRSGDSFSRLPNVEEMEAACYDVSFSPDGAYLAAAHSGGRRVTVFRREGDAFFKLPSLEALPSTGRGIAFSNSGDLLAVAHENSPYLTIYTREGDNFTKMEGLPALSSTGYDVAFSHDDKYLAAAVYGGSVTEAEVYKFEDENYVKLPSLGKMGDSSYCYGHCVGFSHDSTYLAVGHDYSPYLTLFKRVGNTFTKLAPIGDLTSTCYDVAFSHDSKSLAVLNYIGDPYVRVYNYNPDGETQSHNIIFFEPPGKVEDESLGWGNGEKTAFVMEHEPIEGSLYVYVDGEEVYSEDYVVLESTVTLSAAPLSGEEVTVDYNWAPVIAANYKVPYIPKDNNHVLDLQFSIIWGAE